MIWLTRMDRTPVRQLGRADGQVVGLHAALGFLAESSVAARNVLRQRRGLAPVATDAEAWLCRFRLAPGATVALAGCVAVPLVSGQWQLTTPRGDFLLVPESQLIPVVVAPEAAAKAPRAALWVSGLAAAALLAGLVGAPLLRPAVAPKPQVAETQKTVVIPHVKVAPPPPVPPAPPQALAKAPQVKPKTTGAAVPNQLGFLSLLGKETLKNAIGGLPTPAERRTPGAGAGGDKGSGGALLTGLGQGLKRTTVGNTGVSGLGGLGTAGAGGGQGGYGQSYVGSGGAGGGKGLGTVRLGRDVELEGGLDRAVIQATIAKYLSQIRACYERGLRKTPGLTGDVTMSFEVVASGRLSYAKVKQTSLDSLEVESCMSAAMLSWQFPKPVGGTVVSVNYPFTLKPASYM